MKVCSKCKEEKPETFFYKMKTSPDGLQARCKECASAAFKKWHLEKVEKSKVKRRECALEKPERARAANRNWTLKNAERVKAKKREWYLKNAEKVKAASRKRRKGLRKRIVKKPADAGQQRGLEND